MPRIPPVHINNFEARLDAVVRCLVHETIEINNVAHNITSITDFHRIMRADPEGHRDDFFATGDESGKKWLRARANNEVPRELLDFIYRAYPQIRGVFEASDKSWAAYIEPKVTARREWEAAARHLAEHRHDELNKLARQYYRDVDEAQRPDFPVEEFPLVARRDWILQSPLLLCEDRGELPADIRHISSSQRAPALEGIGVTAMALKSSMTLRKRLAKMRSAAVKNAEDQRNVETGYPYWNGKTFRVLDIKSIDGNLQFEFGEGTYFQYVNSCEAVALELAREHMRHGSNLEDLFLPLRVGPSDIFNFLGRETFAGVNCLTILKNYQYPGTTDTEHDVYLIQERDDSVLEAQNCIHVVPAGGHQPLSNDSGDRASIQIWQTVVREFLEELRGHFELDKHSEGKVRLLDAEAERRELNRLFKPDPGKEPVAQIFLLGVGIDPVTTKPEILVTIVMDWRAAQWAMKGQLKLVSNYEGKATPIRFAETVSERKNQLRLEAKGGVHDIGSRGSRAPTLAAGAACFLLAAEHYETLMGIS